MNRITLVTGGARSGKSRHALKLAARCEHKVFLATAEITDADMKLRIDKHRVERDPSFTTIEEPVFLDQALHNLPQKTDVVIIDCLTVWMGNLMVKEESEKLDLEKIQESFLEMLRHPPCDLILVTNEVGCGVHPPTQLGRDFRDRSGRLNQRVAQLAQCVVLVVCGIPMEVKNDE